VLRPHDALSDGDVAVLFPASRVTARSNLARFCRATSASASASMASALLRSLVPDDRRTAGHLQKNLGLICSTGACSGEDRHGRPAGFFDLEERLAGLSQKGDDLERPAAVVDVEVFRSELARAVPRADRSKGGRPPFDHALMFKVLLLQTRNIG
jgi:hypothetical protein